MGDSKQLGTQLQNAGAQMSKLGKQLEKNYEKKRDSQHFSQS